MTVASVTVDQKVTRVTVDSTGRSILVSSPQVKIVEVGKTGPSGPFGLNWKGDWDSGTNYVLNDAVFYAGSSWRALRASVNVLPVAGLDWTPIAEKGGEGDPGPPGQDGVGDSRYTHNQGAASSSWSITHNLGKKPSVTVVDSGENVVVGEVTYTDLNSLVVEFSVPFGGKAYLN